MKSFIRIITYLLISVFLLIALVGCGTGGNVVDTQGDALTQKTQSNDNNSQDNNESPKAEVKEPLDLHGYRIIIPDQNMDCTVESLVAHELKAMLAELGCKVEVAEDEGDVSICTEAILIGQTVATTENMPTGNMFSVTEKDSQVQISAGNYYGYRAAIEFLKEKIAKSNGVPRDLSYAGNATVANATRATSNSLRVMFYNLYGFHNWQTVKHDSNGDPVLDADGNAQTQTLTGADAPSVALRQDLQRDLLSTYAPDVIGFQEYLRSPENGGNSNYGDYHNSFTSSVTKLGYMQVENEVGVENCVPLFYNPLRLRVVESGFSQFTKSSESNTTGMTWAVFEVITGDEVGRVFAVFGTHFLSNPSNLTAAQAEESRTHNATELIAEVNEVLTKYADIAVIVGGDFNYWNIQAEGEAHKTLSNGGLTYMAEPGNNAPAENTNRWKQDGDYSKYTESYHGFYSYDAKNKIYNLKETTLAGSRFTLDYIFLGGNKDSVAVKKFIIINDELTYRASDHSPTYIDFILK